MEFAPETVTKAQAAARQLREAIYLFFWQRDRVAIHTLASAALQVYADIARAKGVTSMLKHAIYVREEKRKEWLAFINAPQNFFKHADKDPDAAIEFLPKLTAHFLVDAVLIQAQLERALNAPSSRAYLAWFYAAYPDLLTDEPTKLFAMQIAEARIDASDFDSFRHLLLKTDQG